MEFFMSDDAIGSDGYLLDKGLIPLPESSRAKYQADAKSLSKLVLN
jgi:phosphate transport system substrate-binding protein